MTEPADVAILILNWNGWSDTQECLQSLRGVPARVILVDNGSSDRSVEMTRTHFPWVEIIENGTNLGFTGGNNRGINTALDSGAQYVMLLNNDTIVEPGFLEPLVRAIDDDSGSVSFASPRIYHADRPNEPWFMAGAIDWSKGLPYQLQDAAGHTSGVLASPIATGCCVLAHRRTWETVGLLDDRFFLYWEDCDWTWRATRAGHGGGVIAESRIWHKVSRSSGTGPALGDFYYARNGLLFIQKHAPRKFLTSARFISWLAREAARGARHGRPRWWRSAMLRATGALAFVCRAYGEAPSIARYIARL